MDGGDLARGLEGVTVAETRLSPVEDLAAEATFEECLFLLVADPGTAPDLPPGDDGAGGRRPGDLFAATFAVARSPGWVAHCLEQRTDNRPIRPRSRYVGASGRSVPPLPESTGGRGGDAPPTRLRHPSPPQLCVSASNTLGG
jgi:hypothetical protein